MHPHLALKYGCKLQYIQNFANLKKMYMGTLSIAIFVHVYFHGFSLEREFIPPHPLA